MSESEDHKSHKSALQIDHPALSCNWPENTTQALLKHLPWSSFNFQMSGTSWLTEGFNFHFFTSSGSVLFLQLVYSNLSWPNCSAIVTVRYYRRGDGEKYTFQETFRSFRMKRREDRLSVKIGDTHLEWREDGDKSGMSEHPTFVFTHKNDEFKMTLELEPTESPIQVGQGETRYGEKGSDGYLLFQFVPCVRMRGEIQINKTGEREAVEGRGIIIHQFQGVRPNIASTRFDVTYFSQVSHSGEEQGRGEDIDLFMVQFQTPKRYGGFTINVGFMTDRKELVALSTGRASMVGDATKQHPSGYKLPSEIEYCWEGKNMRGKPFSVKGNFRTNEPVASINVLESMPFFIRKAVELLVAKPHVFKFVDNEAEFRVQVEGEREMVLKGSLYHEIAFVNVEQ
jgi:hypothetical protein